VAEDSPGAAVGLEAVADHGDGLDAVAVERSGK
jgi:hypothetical protein